MHLKHMGSGLDTYAFHSTSVVKRGRYNESHSTAKNGKYFENGIVTPADPAMGYMPQDPLEPRVTAISTPETW